MAETCRDCVIFTERCGTAWPHAPPPNASNVQRALPRMTALHPDTMNTSLQTVAPPAPDASLRMLKHGTRLLEPDVYVARVGARQAVFKDYRRYKWTPLAPRSEEHTSELQSLMRISYAVFCL